MSTIIKPIEEKREIIKKSTELKNAIIYVDYENIYGRLQDYGKTIFELNFVDRLKAHIEKKYHLLDFVFYANFDLEHFHSSFHQSYLQTLGVTTKHTLSQGKNSSDIYLVVDALNSVYRNELLDVVIIISCDRDMIPLIQSIKKESKYIYLITTKNGLEKSMICYANHHEYLEDILNIQVNEIKINDSIDVDKLNSDDIRGAEQIIDLLINSNIWGKYKYKGIPINFNEYKKHVTRARRILPEEVERLFKIANALGWIDFYNYKRNQEDIIGIKEGKNFNEFLATYTANLLSVNHVQAELTKVN